MSGELFGRALDITEWFSTYQLLLFPEFLSVNISAGIYFLFYHYFTTLLELLELNTDIKCYNKLDFGECKREKILEHNCGDWSKKFLG